MASPKSILSWYDHTRPTYIDLIGDFAGKEVFLVEGDSLLRECFDNEHLDMTNGLQVLNAVYLVEIFLDGLLRRHSNFHITFFDNNALLCIPSGRPSSCNQRYLFAREAIIQHLHRELPKSHPDILVSRYPSARSEEFEKYREATGFHFVLIHDGAFKSASVAGPGEGEINDAKILLRGLIYWFNTQCRLYVALTNRIELVDTKVFTMIVESSAKRSSKAFDESLGEARQRLEASQPERSVSDDEITKSLANTTTFPAEWTERLRLTVHSIKLLFDRKVADETIASAFVLHTILLEHLTLAQRRLELVTFDEDIETKVQEALSVASSVMLRVCQDDLWKAEAGEHIGCQDAIDGRLFRVVLNTIKNDTLPSLPTIVAGQWSKACGLIGISAKDSGKEPFQGQEKDSEVEDKSFTVMAFSNPTFDKHLEVIHVNADSKDSVANQKSMKLYREVSHWHNYKRPLNPKLAPAPVKVSKWRNPLRTNQFYMSEMTTYAASLTGAKGRVLEPETITVGKRPASKAVESSKAAEKAAEAAAKDAKKDSKKDTKGAKKGAKEKPLTKAQLIVAQNKERKGGTESEKAFQAWAAIMKGFNEISDNQQRYLRAKSYLDSLDSTKLSHIESDVNAYILQSLLAWWAKFCDVGKKSEGYHVVALIWNVARELSSRPITKDLRVHLKKIGLLLGITEAAEISKASTASDIDRKLSFTFQYPSTKPETLRIVGSEREFQLLNCGPYMDRATDAKPDARVPFQPDAWQRKVLDELDSNRSVFVVAPTSAGKTFISFYAMEQVLRADNESVLVYVAPTKALVNQIAAEIQGRFSKKFPQAGTSVWAIHTRDYRINNPTGCQILVTVPHILQIMLLAPTNSKSWAPRVKRIIFDEVHSIGQAEDGVVWEQLLLLAPCPIIALSATVGNPEQFNEWLASTQKASGTELTMIQHHTRYSDLRKYFYTPPKSFVFEGLGKAPALGVALGLDGLEGLTYFHPVASLVDKSRGMPDDLSLEPRDCLYLWTAMCKHQTKEYPVSANLHPDKALPACIKKVDVFKWEKALKETLSLWMAEPDSPFDKVVQELGPTLPLSQQVGDLSISDDESSDSDDSESESSRPSSSSSAEASLESIDPYNLRSTTLPLLVQLHQRRALPAILFNYDRAGCEDVAFALLKQLKGAESLWKDTSPQWKKLVDGFAKFKEMKDKKSKKPAKPIRNKGDSDDKLSKADQARDDASTESNFYDSFDPEEPQEDFTFADKMRCQRSEVETYIRQLRWKGIREEFIALLQRGIGVHHAGMNRKYRQCVEMLFRKGFLRVVIATGTLSLGINMPCATVVFLGDSVFLTALNFRQAAGRSGRRGFDLLGNVVFSGITNDRACRLLSSRLPDIQGHFPITTTLVLRLFTLLHESKNSPYARRSIDALLSQPRIYLGGDSFKEQVLHHLRFSIEYLRRMSLLGPGGEPVNFTSCVSHLYFTENSAFAFHALLKDGYFNRLCADIETSNSANEDILRNMMLVLSHLFGRRVCREIDDDEYAEKVKRSPSMVYLPSMPEDAADVLRKHNSETLDIFTTYVKTFAEQHLKSEETALPLTKTVVSPPEDPSLVGIIPSLPKPKACSAFIALSGHGDKFDSIADLCSSARNGIFLESAVIPHLDLHPDETRTPLNAYLLDFFMHGAVKPLEDANGIRRSDVWFLLNDFSMVLGTITSSIANYLGLGFEDPELLDIMGTGDAAENDEDEREAAAAEVSTETRALTSNAPKVFKPKKKVADDWDAAEDEIGAHEAIHAPDDRPAVSDEEEYDAMLKTFKAFSKLKNEFDTKFREMWA